MATSRATRSPWSARCARASSTAPRSRPRGWARSTRASSSSRMPGLFRDWAPRFDNARNTMRPSSTRRSEKEGFLIGGWGDVGIAHLMTKGFEVHGSGDLEAQELLLPLGRPDRIDVLPGRRGREPEAAHRPGDPPRPHRRDDQRRQRAGARGRAAPVVVAPRSASTRRRADRDRRSAPATASRDQLAPGRPEDARSPSSAHSAGQGGHAGASGTRTTSPSAASRGGWRRTSRTPGRESTPGRGSSSRPATASAGATFDPK